MSNQIIKIGKRVSDKVVCWRVKADELTPNTEIALERGITAVVTVNGERRVQMREKSTVFALFNAGKNKKLFGGNTPYKDFEICAIDQASDFTAGWAFGINDPLSGFDSELGIACDVLARGTFNYKIDNFVAFVGSMTMIDGEICADDIANEIRGNVLGVIRPHFTSELKSKNINDCQANFERYSKELLSKINGIMEPKGMQVTSVTIEAMEYSPTHTIKRREYESAVVENIVEGVKAETDRTKIETRGQEVSKVDVPLMNAQANLERAKGSEKSEQAFMYCPSCKTKNDLSAISCKNCGMSFKK